MRGLSSFRRSSTCASSAARAASMLVLAGAAALTGCTSHAGPQAASSPASPSAGSGTVVAEASTANPPPPAGSSPIAAPPAGSAPAAGDPSSSAPVSSLPTPFPSPPLPVSTAKDTYFQSPTGNLRCSIAADGPGGFNKAECGLLQYSWALPPKPADCIFDWGGVVDVEATGPGQVACHSDGPTAAGVLAYGNSIRRGPFSCTSEPSGMTCRNSDTGHGFTVSRESFRGF